MHGDDFTLLGYEEDLHHFADKMKTWYEIVVRGILGPDLKDKNICLKCKGTMLACSREGIEKMLDSWINSEDEADQVRMVKNAEIIQNRGYEGILCLMARGVGEATAQRILRKVPRNEIDNLLRTIHNAEIEYARTRRFWG